MAAWRLLIYGYKKSRASTGLTSADRRHVHYKPDAPCFGWIPAWFPAMGPDLYKGNTIHDFLKFFCSWPPPFSRLTLTKVGESTGG